MSFGSILDSFSSLHAVVVGDLMLDEYIFGRATRISPEAPVMVIRRERGSAVPGGAANVAKNIRAFGAGVSIAGIVGDDEAGRQLTQNLAEEGSALSGVIAAPRRLTTRKTRVVADHSHQVLRIDHEDDEPISTDIESAMLEAAIRLLNGSHVLVLSDYRKGTLSQSSVTELVRYARSAGKPVVANPKPRTAHWYSGATLLSMNRVEITDLLGSDRTVSDEGAVEACRAARDMLGIQVANATLGESGMVAWDGKNAYHARAPRVEVHDTAGAGDTVIATLALCQAAGTALGDALVLAAHVSARVVQRVGVAAPTSEDLAALRAI